MQHYSDIDLTPATIGDIQLHGSQFEHCTFTGVQLQGADLSHSVFSDCTFVGCDLSNAQIGDAYFQQVELRECKAIGLRFDTCQDLSFAVKAIDCDLSHASFYQKNLTKSHFENCQMTELDLEEVIMDGITMTGCMMSDARFDRTSLRDADLRDSRGYIIDPTKNQLFGAKISPSALPGLVQHLGIIVDD